MNASRRRFALQTCLALATAILLSSNAVGSTGTPNIGWIKGPTTANLGNDVAQIVVDGGYLFANAADTKRFMESIGNPPSGKEVGLLTPRGQDANWFIVFEYDSVGYVKDDEKDQIDSAALLKAIQDATEKANETRRQGGHSALHIVGWQEKPHYDERSHNLEWAILGKNDDGSTVVNYNVRQLGRYGYMSVTLVDDPSGLAASRPMVDRVLAGFSYKPGRTYAEFVSGDRLAGYGLAALVVGGAAVKLGLLASLGKFLAKAYKLVVLALVAVIGAFKKIARAIFQREERITMPERTASETPRV